MYLVSVHDPYIFRVVHHGLDLGQRGGRRVDWALRLKARIGLETESNFVSNIPSDHDVSRNDSSLDGSCWEEDYGGRIGVSF